MKKQAVIVIVANDQGELLLAHSKTNRNDWGFPGGKVEHGEPLLVAAERELREETGYTCDKLTRIYVAQDGDYEVTCYVGDDFRFVNAENEGLGKWGTIAELMQPSNTHFMFNNLLVTRLTICSTIFLEDAGMLLSFD